MVSAPQGRALLTLLQSKRRPADSAVTGWELWTAAGTRRYGSATLSPRDSAVLADAAATALRADSASRSALCADDDRVHFWNVALVRSRERVVGVLADRRRVLGSAQAERTIARLTGQDVHVYRTGRDSSEWVSIAGRPVDSPVASASIEPSVDSGVVRIAGAPGGPVYLSAGSVPGTPWRIVLSQPESSVVARPRAFLREMLLIGALLIVGGTIVAWWLSRRELPPLVELRHAAESMAHGDYSRVGSEGGAKETAALATATAASRPTSRSDLRAVRHDREARVHQLFLPPPSARRRGSHHHAGS